MTEKPFRLLWIGRTASSFGDSLVWVALAFAVLSVGGSATQLGIVIATSTVVRAAFVVVGGVWADRLPRRLVMLTCDVARAAVEVFVAVGLLTGFMRWWMFLFTASVFGAAAAFFGPASTGLVPQTITTPRLQQANALLSLSQNATSVFGPALSGLIVAAASPGWVFAIDAATFIVSTISLARLRLPPLAKPVKQRFFADVADGWQEVRGRSWLWGSFIAFSLINFAVGAAPVLGPVIAQQHLGGAQAWGLIVTGGAVGGLIGGVLAYRLRPSRPLVACYIGWGLMSATSLALAPPLPVAAIMVASGIFSLGLALGNTLWDTVLQQQIPAEQLSRVSSIDWMVSLVFMPLGSALAGPLAAAIGDRTILLAAGLLIIGVTAAIFLALPPIRRLRTREAVVAEAETPSLEVDTVRDEDCGVDAARSV